MGENPDLNLIIYFNHLAFSDPVLILWLYFKFLDPQGERRLILPASHWHTNFFHNPVYASAYRLGQILLNFKGVPIVQTYQVDNPSYGYTPAQALKTYRNLLKAIGDNPQNMSLIISPEGHRSENGTLQEGEKGIEKLARRLCPCLLLPTGIVYPDGFDPQTMRDSLNFGRRVNLVVGPPISYDNEKQSLTHEMIMNNLALTLSPEMRGFWKEKVVG